MSNPIQKCVVLELDESSYRGPSASCMQLRAPKRECKLPARFFHFEDAEVMARGELVLQRSSAAIDLEGSWMRGLHSNWRARKQEDPSITVCCLSWCLFHFICRIIRRRTAFQQGHAFWAHHGRDAGSCMCVDDLCLCLLFAYLYTSSVLMLFVGSIEVLQAGSHGDSAWGQAIPSPEAQSPISLAKCRVPCAMRSEFRGLASVSQEAWPGDSEISYGGVS